MSDKIPPESEWPDGFIPKAVAARKVQDRLSEVVAERDMLRAKVAELNPAASELAEVRQAFDAYRMDVERDAAFRTMGLGLDGLDEEQASARTQIRSAIEQLYASHNAASEEPIDLATYLRDVAPTHPLIAHALPAADTTAAPSTPAPGGAPPPAPRGAGPLRGAQEPAPPKRTSVGEVRKFVREAAARGDKEDIAAAKNLLRQAMGTADA